MLGTRALGFRKFSSETQALGSTRPITTLFHVWQLWLYYTVTHLVEVPFDLEYEVAGVTERHVLPHLRQVRRQVRQQVPPLLLA